MTLIRSINSIGDISLSLIWKTIWLSFINFYHFVFPISDEKHIKRQHLTPETSTTMSYSYGRSMSYLQATTLSSLLDRQTKIRPHQPAIISSHEQIIKTFAQLSSDVSRISYSLKTLLSVKQGDVVAVMTANCYSFVVLQYAVSRIGAILCPINAYYTKDELSVCLKMINAKVFFIPGKASAQLDIINTFDFDDILNDLVIIYLDTLGDKQHVDNIHKFTWDQLMGDGVDHGGYVDPDSVAALFFTSGTTGPPKAAALSHFNISNNIRFFGERLGFNIDENVRICLPVPVFHVFGSLLGIATIAACGTTCVMPTYRYDVRTVISCIIKYKCTHLYGVPAMLIDIMNELYKTSSIRGVFLPSLKHVVTAATSVPYEVVNSFKSLVSINTISIVYGATETSPIITAPIPYDDMQTRLDNVGLALDFTEIKIVKDGKIVALGEEGELLTRGPNVFLGYYNNGEIIKNVDESDWYNTGDLARMDEKGYIRIVGRTKEIIIRGGINIYPKEIEDVLISHPLISFAAVCGVPDSRLGEDVCAWIQLKDDTNKLSEKQIKEFCKGKIAYFKIPRRMIFVKDFPRTASGKVQKFIMCQESCKLLRIKC